LFYFFLKIAIIKIIKTNFLKNINEIPKQFLFNPKIINIDNLKIKKPKYFIILGMGGSALAGDLLKNCLSNSKLIIHKNYGLPLVPEEILKNSLIIAISYSGNTEEVIDGYNQAKRKK
jgi:glucose-6-phosphate isomerase